MQDNNPHDALSNQPVENLATPNQAQPLAPTPVPPTNIEIPAPPSPPPGNPVYPPISEKKFDAPSVPDSQAPAPTVQKDGKTKILTVIVILLGLWIAVPRILGLLGVPILVSFTGVNASSVLMTVFAVIFIVLGIGISLRRELVRIPFVALSVIFLVISTVSLVRVVNAISKTECNEALGTQRYVDDTKKRLKAVLDPRLYEAGLPSLEKQVETAKRHDALCQALKSSVKGPRFYMSMAYSYTISIVPLIFLTRPSVKKIFS